VSPSIQTARENSTSSHTTNTPPACIEQNVSLRDKNWFKTGGSARCYAAPDTPEKFQVVLAFAQEQSLPIFVLGCGANILISDAGFDGLVIKPELRTIEHSVDPQNTADVLLTAGAGATIDQLISYCLDHNLVGLEEFSGIPATVGGAVFINLHYYEHTLSQFLVSAQIIEKETGTIKTVPAEWFSHGYDQSKLFEGTHYVVSATFKVRQATEIEAAYAKGRRTEIIKHRVKRYPSTNTCGSFFRNFHDHEVTMMSNGKKMIHTAYYLDKLGIKGTLQVGDAMVSWQHANMLVNKGNATSADIIQLARIMQQLVFNTFGIIPQPECLLIGFSEYPLLK
jgi:UDP-N-acetylmuramate dehydrogenase